MTFQLAYSKRAFMKIEVKVPSVDKSVSTADIESWEKQTGDWVKKGDILVILETDKASMEVPAEKEGRLEILKPKGTQVSVDEIIALIETGASKESSIENQKEQKLKDRSELKAPVGKTEPASQKKLSL